MVGLNASASLCRDWSTFHKHGRGRSDYKLMRAFDDSKLRGVYMTDLFKGVYTTTGKELRLQIGEGDVDVHEHIRAFRAEMRDIGAGRPPRVILFGEEVNWYFMMMRLHIDFPNPIKCPHYSRASPAVWHRDVMRTLGKLSRPAR